VIIDSAILNIHHIKLLKGSLAVVVLVHYYDHDVDNAKKSRASSIPHHVVELVKFESFESFITRLFKNRSILAKPWALRD
jgi:hypothetical protein